MRWSARVAVLAIVLMSAPWTLGAERPVSHPPLRPLPQAAERPLEPGPTRYVDAKQGDDQHDGSAAKPWRTISHALTQLHPGETLVLRGGVYYESIRCAIMGTAEKPITIRSAKGELAILDGGWREFAEQPEQAWELVSGATDEYRSTRAYPNVRYALGSFADSYLGLNTYYHARDLRATSEMMDPERPDDKTSDVKSLYCGPGLWYDPATQRIHARLAHTHLPEVANYQGPTDPRRVPLLVVAANSTPLWLDGARHLRIQDIVIRGAGHNTVLFEQTENITLDNVTVYCGSNGLRMIGAVGLKLWRCGVFGNVPPWTYRQDTSKRAYPGRPLRDITRLNTHALLVPDAGQECDVYAYPQNEHWEIAYCDFGDAHDGVYIGGVTGVFHHNLIDGTQDDGIYLSPMYPSYLPKPSTIVVRQNIIRRCLTALAFGGKETTTDQVRIEQNVFDLREKIPTGRPSTRDPQSRFSMGKVMGDHGSPPWPAMRIVHNTAIMAESTSRSAEMALSDASHLDRPRYVFNNLFVHPGNLPPLKLPIGASDGNVYWSPTTTATQFEGLLTKARKLPEHAASQTYYPAQSLSQVRLGDPLLDEEYRPQQGSAAIDAGVLYNPGIELAPTIVGDRGAPDAGAIPLGGAPLRVGRSAIER